MQKYYITILALLVFLIYVEAGGNGISDEARARYNDQAKSKQSHTATEAGHYTSTEYSYRRGYHHTYLSGSMSSEFYSVLGIFILLFSLAALWWNEKNTKLNEKMIKKGQVICREVSSEAIRPEDDHRLIFTKGIASSCHSIYDEELNINAKSALKLSRKVEMYLFEQKVHTRKSNFATRREGRLEQKTYEYVPCWSTSYIDHKNFKDFNIKNPGPEAFLFKSKDFYPESANLGAFKLKSDDIQSLATSKTFQLAEIPSLPQQALELINSCQINNRTAKPVFKNGYLYLKYDCSETDSIGDLRISYTYLPSEIELAVVAMQIDGCFRPYNYKQMEAEHLSDEARALFSENIKEDDSIFQKITSCCCDCLRRRFNQDQSIYWLYTNKLTKKEIFEDRLAQNSSNNWNFWFVCFFLLYIGIYFTFDSFTPLILRLISLFVDLGSWVIYFVWLFISIFISKLIVSLS